MAKKKSDGTKTTDKTSLNKRLLQYSVVAGAALSLASPQEASAAVHYSGVQNILVDTNSGFALDMDTFSGNSHPNPDFYFYNSAYTGPTLPYAFNGVYGLNYSNELLVGTTSGLFTVKYLVESIPFSNRLQDITATPPPGFTYYATLNARVAFTPGLTFTFGNFVGTPGYIGVRFLIGANTHYGWIQIQSAADLTSTTIIDWAYEDQPDTPIHVGSKPVHRADPTTVPTLNQWGLFILCALILAEGARRLSRKEDEGDTGPLGSA